MKKILLYSLSLIFTIQLMIPAYTFAYSYGDPNEEKVAEAYKEMKLKLNEDPVNYDAAKEIYLTVQEEIDMHMGADVSDVILADFESKQKNSIIKDMEKILVLNIARRLENVEKNFDDYETSKRLLAKAFATYEALSPNVTKNDEEADQQLRSEFDNALEALGNPGLFGVGKKEASKEQFVNNKDKILTELKEQFSLKSLDVGHFSESATETEQPSGGKDWTDLSNVKNWIPLLLIATVIIAIVIYTVRKRKV